MAQAAVRRIGWHSREPKQLKRLAYSTRHFTETSRLQKDHTADRSGRLKQTGKCDMATKFGNDSNNYITGTSGTDTLYGLGGNDNILGLEGDDEILGGSGNDIIAGGLGDDYVHGGTGLDSLLFYETGDIFINLDAALPNANKAVQVGAGTDTIYSIESFWFNVGDDTFIGNSQANEVLAAAGDDALYGNGGDDGLYGGAGDDTLSGGDGADILSGDDDDDTIFGGNGGDTLNGGAGFDHLEGGADDDTIAGGGGNDMLDGGVGLDSLTGGGGADDFRFDAGDSGVGAGNRDQITDFSHTHNDDIDLSSFGGLDFIGTAGFSAAGQVRFWHSGADTIVAINTAGNSGAEMQIELAGIVNLAAGDFVL